MLTATILISPVQEADWLTLKNIRLASLRDSPKAFGMTLAAASSHSQAQWRERAASPRARFFLANVQGRAVGLIGVTAIVDGDCELIAMWVRPAARGSGVAAMLVGAVKDAAIAGGARRVNLAVAPDNLAASRLYQRQGFRFLPAFEALTSDPAITLQKMAWTVVA
ncbi:GNAT family N-acetyltransferase [Massilia sp. PAMC28688]|uniref:GNAT family N-acetyltransferase n=1 Tax=Massilia sp. PAMC28688 TaxID=2861283 RepID=UPI001C62517B|nr:GNAT family N-acetyltransferase [Massilia sp. PAMC28688]QYF95697.1 GNAT family N-acetyltransferase [Massilia sp. PAMC28688]